MNIKVVLSKKLMEKLQERYAKKRGIKSIWAKCPEDRVIPSGFVENMLTMLETKW
jgi:hypothetical protein